MIVALPQESLPVAVPVAEGAVGFVHSIVTSLGIFKVGAVVSTMLMVCTRVVVLLQSSVRDHVRVIVSALAQLPLATLSVYVACRPDEQLSFSFVTSPVLALDVSSPHWIVISAGSVNVGATVSATTIFCDTEDEFPQSSINVHVLTIVILHGLELSTLSTPVTVILLMQLSVAVNWPGAGTSSIQLKYESAGALGATGLVVSLLLNVAVVVVELPQPSVAVKVTVADPVSPQPPESEVKLLVQIISEQSSVAVAPPFVFNQFWIFSVALLSILHSIIWSEAEIVITGGVVSWIV